MHIYTRSNRVSKSQDKYVTRKEKKRKEKKRKTEHPSNTETAAHDHGTATALDLPAYSVHATSPWSTVAQ